MKPQDVLLLLKIISINKQSWNQKTIAEVICMSQSEVSESVARSKYADLLDSSGRQVMKLSLMDFLNILKHNIHYGRYRDSRN